MNYGQRIKAIREREGIKLKDLAELSGISNTTLCNIEKCRYACSITTLERIAKALQVSLSDLL
jgi:transcriptional regulator with XRE-family HTH domain